MLIFSCRHYCGTDARGFRNTCVHTVYSKVSVIMMFYKKLFRRVIYITIGMRMIVSFQKSHSV